MAASQPQDFEAFAERSAFRAALPYVVGLLLVGLLVWLVFRQLTSVVGIRVNDDPKAMVDVSPLPPPPPPPPPPPEPKEKPPEPTEQPQPSPAEAAKAPQQPAAAPVSMAAAAEAGSDSYGVAAGSGNGIGAPSSGGTCLGTKCGPGGGGGGMGLKLYDRYLSDALQTRVDRDDRANRQVFSADFLIWVSPRGKVTAVRTVRSTGSEGRDKLLADILDTVDGLSVPPGEMSFPRKITVRGRRGM